ncbi:MAG: isoprenylcysteine carboxylmethyltransferase family protein [Syntrophales bacterium]|nr:isoprenylcysteine carboxylmethyltransferase family protein [Syntrophales bacterium]
MALREELEKTGHWLFRWRSYLPLLVIGLSIIAFREFQYPFSSHLMDNLWELFCLAVSMVGIVVRALTIGFVPEGTSGRNTKEQVANELNTAGMYSIVRHPLYLGNFIIWFGISLFVRLWWLSLIIILIFWLYYERIIFAEEEFLRRKFGHFYLEWAERTPAFFPKFSLWRRPTLSFSLRTALKEEYSGFFAIIATFTFLEIMGDYFVEGILEFDTLWQVIFFCGLCFYMTVRIMKKANLLNVEGRP